MQRLLFVLSLVLYPMFAQAAGAPISTQAFMEPRRGNYQILLAGGVAPVEGDNHATIQLNRPEEEEFTLPYCLPNGCDPGWIYFPYGKTQIIQEGTVYNITVNVDGKVLNYAWEEKASGEIIFRNFQYQMPGADSVVTLEHVLKRVSALE